MGCYTPSYKIQGNEVAVFETSKGTIKVKLDGEGAPIHVANFCELAQKGFYDNLKFHRYVPGFVIQGGCPNTRSMTEEEVAMGACGKDGILVRAAPAIASKRNLLLILTIRTSTPHLLWRAPRCPIQLDPSFTSAWALNMSLTRATRFLVPRSRAKMLSHAFAQVISSNTLASRIFKPKCKAS